MRTYKVSKHSFFSPKLKVQCLIITLIVLAHLPIIPEIHFIIIGILMIVIFFFASWKNIITYTELILLGLLKDLIASAPLGISSIELIVVYLIGNFIKKVTNDRSLTKAFVAFIITALFVYLLRETMISIVYKQIAFNKKYFRLAILYPIVFYIPFHLLFTKYIKLEDARSK